MFLHKKKFFPPFLGIFGPFCYRKAAQTAAKSACCTAEPHN